MNSSERSPLSRRSMFVGAGTAGALAAAASLLPAAQPDQSGVPAAQADQTGEAHGRYQETAHVRQYYQTAKV